MTTPEGFELQGDCQHGAGHQADDTLSTQSDAAAEAECSDVAGREDGLRRWRQAADILVRQF